MKQILLLAFVAFFISWKSEAQDKPGKVTGSIKDINSKVVEAATISLVRKADSAVVKYAVADKAGRFEFDHIAGGEYLVKVSAVGHSTVFSEAISISEVAVAASVKPLILSPLAKEMNAVTVTAKKPFIEQKIDRTVVNVEASVTNAGSTALDVLERSPGITIDKDGNISLKGKQGVMVMMDGRPTYLSAAELTNYLRNLPATAIEQIEIITNPSAKYDAAGNSGVINIKSKKNKQKGFNGNLSLNYGQGRYWKSNNSVNMNYRTGKVNVFASAGASQWNGFQKLDIHRKFLDPNTKDVKAIFDQTSNMNNTSNYYNLKLGADYYLSKKTTLGIVSTGFYNPETFSSRNLSFLKDDHGQVDSIAYAQSSNNNLWQNGSLNLNARHQFDSAGRELTADADYITYRADNSQTYSSTSFDADWLKKGIEHLRGDLPVSIDIYSLKMDYTHPLGKEAKLEAGVKSSYVETDNAANYFTVGDRETPDYNKTNHFIYRENINAAYLNLNKQFNKFGVQAGLRYEHTLYNGKQHGNPTRQDSAFEKGYGNLFPTLFVSYKADKNNQWAISFGRRINRPAYQDLNPFMFFLDNYTYGSGNPFLRPQFSNNIELTHTFKSFLTTTVNYGRTKDMMNETFEQAKNLNGSNEYATIVRKGNIGERNTAGIAVSAQIQPLKWWSGNVYANYNYNKFSGFLYGEYIDIEASNVSFNMNNQFKFNKGWSAELSGWYRTKGIEGQILIQPMGAASAGISKQILKQKGSVKLNVRDMFYTQFPKGDINFQNTRAHFENRRDSRVINLGFSYRFGKPIKDQRQRKNGGVDEQNRVKVGGGN